MLGNLSTFVSKKLGVVIALATMVSQVAEVSPEIALAKIVAYALLGIGYVIAQAAVDKKYSQPFVVNMPDGTPVDEDDFDNLKKGNVK